MQYKAILVADASKHDHVKGTLTLGISVYVGDWYVYGGTLYECILAHIAGAGNYPPNTTYWTPVVPAGTPLGSVSWKGAWSSGTTYAAGDGCTLSGHAYVSIVGSNLNHSPPNVTYWVEVYYSVATGNVVGPGSSVDSNVAEFSGTTGLLLKDGALTHANVADAVTKKHSADTDPSETSGWVPAPALTFGAADAPTYTVTCSGDYSAVITPGMRMKMTQSSAVKYFIVTKVTYSSPNTTITLYGGTDYTLGSTITLPYYSMMKAPAGFPMDPVKWTVTVTDSTQYTQNSPVSGTWYNLGSKSIAIPIGLWQVYVLAYVDLTKASGAGSVECALSVNNNDGGISGENVAVAQGNPTIEVGAYLRTIQYLNLATKTTYYLNEVGFSIGATTTLYLFGNYQPTIIKAVSAYL